MDQTDGALHKARLNYIKQQIQLCRNNALALKSNASKYEQEFIDQFCCLTDAREQVKMLTAQVQAFRQENLALNAEINHQLTLHRDKDDRIQQLEDTVQVYKTRNSALLQKLQKVSVYINDNNNERAPSTLKTQQDAKLLKENKKLQLQTQVMTQKLEKYKAKPKSAQISQFQINEIKTEIKTQKKATKISKKQQVQIKNVLQEILFPMAKIESKQTEIRTWTNEMIRPPIKNGQIVEMNQGCIKILRTLAKQLHTQKAQVDTGFANTVLTNLSEQLKIQMMETPERVYKCLCQLNQLAQFFIYDGEYLAKLFDKFYSNSQMFEDTQSSSDDQLCLEKILRHLDQYYRPEYNQTEYFKLLDYHKKKESVQFNATQIQSVSFGAAESIHNYLLQEFLNNNEKFMGILKLHIQELLEQLLLKDKLDQIYQIILTKESLSIRGSAQFSLNDNRDLVDFSLLFCTFCVVMNLSGYKVHMFEQIMNTKKVLIDRYSSFMKMEDVNGITDDHIVAPWFPAFSGWGFIFGARISGK
ncbi:Conserved_hypothetical protein [Hexamita inflata]|uniref:Uncharacterized protein n=1 Tax=Hexamita inflata TaxID=28002 RepID=A0AA86QHN6_9EUKA|nr:Conserved hypothetical protein [Hexamita inflata]